MFFAQPGPCQDLSGDLKEKINSCIEKAYQAAAAEFPCKLSAGGKPTMLHWEQVDRCLNNASARVDWNSLSAELQSLRTSGVKENDFWTAVDAALSAHAVPYEKVFSVKNLEAMIPLTNSLLKYLPTEALQDVPVLDKAGTHLGVFFGTYSFERTGALASANTYRLALFQYTDREGNIQSAMDKLLLDSFGVPWKQAAGKGAFRLPPEKLLPLR